MLCQDMLWEGANSRALLNLGAGMVVTLVTGVREIEDDPVERFVLEDGVLGHRMGVHVVQNGGTKSLQNLHVGACSFVRHLR